MLKSLHVSNVANVAYSNAKILNKRGWPAQVICHDVKHLMSQPEWDDLLLDPQDFPDETDFYNNTADFGGYSRPEWFKSDSLADPYADVSQIHARLLAWLARRLPREIKRTLEPAYYRLMRMRMGMKRMVTGQKPAPVASEDVGVVEKRLRTLIDTAAGLGPQWQLDEVVLRRYLPHRAWLASHAACQDVVFSYVLSPIYAMLYGLKPQVSVEIGTMREIPLGTSATSRLLWLAYRLSDHVVLTNPDNRSLADEGGVTSYSFCPHPIDDEMFRPGEEQELRRELLGRHDAQFVLFAPARQNWKVKGNDKLIRAFARLRRSGVNAVLLLPAWGQEIERSKALSNSLGIQAHTVWLPPLSEPLLARYYRAVDLVLDQFQLGVFGLITPKAMSCGTPVLTSYDVRHHNWCFPVDPPVVSCWTEEDIFAAISDLTRDAGKRAEIGAASRAWVERHHSQAVVADALTSAMEIAVENFKRRSA
ncbi:MAG: glycosyltransferase family 4 protein [Betaproteobacteria bacterium]|nr:glycosyltransferase family 4 protein [Betaproteobacteria bacterium]